MANPKILGTNGKPSPKAAAILRPLDEARPFARQVFRTLVADATDLDEAAAAAAVQRAVHVASIEPRDPHLFAAAAMTLGGALRTGLTRDGDRLAALVGGLELAAYLLEAVDGDEAAVHLVLQLAGPEIATLGRAVTGATLDEARRVVDRAIADVGPLGDLIKGCVPEAGDAPKGTTDAGAASPA